MSYILIIAAFVSFNILGMQTGAELAILRSTFEDIGHADKENNKQEITKKFKQYPRIIYYLTCHIRRWDLAYRLVKNNPDVSYELSLSDLKQGRHKIDGDDPELRMHLLTCIDPRYLSHNLTKLNISYNNLSEQPDLSSLPNLKTLNLSGNSNITEFYQSRCPAELESLDVSGLSLERLHFILENLKKLTAHKLLQLRHIYIRHTELKEIDVTPEDMPYLTTLDVYNNNQLLSVSINKFPKLIQADLAKTALPLSYILGCHYNVLRNRLTQIYRDGNPGYQFVTGLLNLYHHFYSKKKVKKFETY